MRPAPPALSRRQLLLAGLATTLPAGAQTTAWPNKPLRLHKDWQPGGQLANSLLFLIARPGLPVNTLRKLVAHAKAHPDTLNYGSAGVGTTPRMCLTAARRRPSRP